MSLPEPLPGLVIRYSYVWRQEAARGQDEGKARPCAVVLALRRANGRTTVLVAPITRTPPQYVGQAIEIPAATKRRLGLDHNRSWIITDDLNFFEWPGPDIRPIDAKHGIVYGYLPKMLADKVIMAVRAQMRTGSVKTTDRDG